MQTTKECDHERQDILYTVDADPPPGFCIPGPLRPRTDDSIDRTAAPDRDSKTMDPRQSKATLAVGALHPNTVNLH